jgi:hypothetical protein
MVIYLHEERAYLYWVAHHRGGFVLDCARKPTPRHLVLHRATCGEVKTANGKRTHHTTGKHAKACSLDADELRAWALEQTAAEPANCSGCRPHEQPQPGEAGAEPHLSRLPREILSFILEIAVIHLDDPSRTFHLTVADVAQCFDKTPGQLTQPLGQLWEQGMITVSGRMVPGHALSPRRVVCPTAAALRTLPAYAAEDSDAEADVQRLLEAEGEN